MKRIQAYITRIRDEQARRKKKKETCSGLEQAMRGMDPLEQRAYLLDELAGESLDDLTRGFVKEVYERKETARLKKEISAGLDKHETPIDKINHLYSELKTQWFNKEDAEEGHELKTSLLKKRFWNYFDDINKELRRLHEKNLNIPNGPLSRGWSRVYSQSTSEIVFDSYLRLAEDYSRLGDKIGAIETLVEGAQRPYRNFDEWQEKMGKIAQEYVRNAGFEGNHYSKPSKVYPCNLFGDCSILEKARFSAQNRSGPRQLTTNHWFDNDRSYHDSRDCKLYFDPKIVG